MAVLKEEMAVRPPTQIPKKVNSGDRSLYNEMSEIYKKRINALTTVWVMPLIFRRNDSL